MLITNDPFTAIKAENSGIDWIFIDLELLGKEERQKGMNTVISKHNLNDIKIIKSVIKKAKVLVRINPINENSQYEIDQVIANGADIVMLPFFKRVSEVETFLKFVNGRAKSCLLLETKEAVDRIDEIISLRKIDFLHIGLNDLHLSYNNKFMFEPLYNGIVDSLIEKIKKTEIIYGFGGIAKLGEGEVPSNLIISEHYRLGSQMAILSRTFYSLKNVAHDKSDFDKNVQDIRSYEEFLSNQDHCYFNKNHDLAMKSIKDAIDRR